MVNMSEKDVGHSRRRKVFTAVIVLAFLAAVSGVVLLKRSSKPDAAASPVGTKIISIQGGTYDLGALSVTAPAGTVAVDTAITAGPAMQPTPQTPGPLTGARTHAVHFDLSLARGLQPARTLEVTIPLTGSMLPPGANPASALLYSPTPERPSEFGLVPTTFVAATDRKPATLIARVAHLSPKWIVFPSFADVMEQVVKPPGPKAAQCPAVKRTDVRLVPHRSWSPRATSPLHPCLVGTDQGLELTVTNNAGYMWSIRPENNAKVTSVSNDDEAEAIKYLTDMLFSNVQGTSVTGYLAEGSQATAQLDTADLPATVKFEASPNTFLAQSVWISANFIANLVLGSSGTSKTTRIVGDVLKSAEVVVCLKRAIRVDTPINYIGKVMDFVVSTCGEMIATAVSNATATNIVAWRILWERLFTLAIGFRDAINNAGTAIIGAYRQAKGLVTVTVAAATPDCLSRTVLFRTIAPTVSPSKMDASPIVCQATWATAAVWSLPASENSEAAHYVLRFENGRWQIVAFGVDTWILEDKPICRQLPTKVRVSVCPA